MRSLIAGLVYSLAGAVLATGCGSKDESSSGGDASATTSRGTSTGATTASDDSVTSSSTSGSTSSSTSGASTNELGETRGDTGASEPTCTPELEVCDGADNDCDGLVDNVDGGSCGGCQEGATECCYDGPPETEAVGACLAGTRTCTNGAWGPCEGAVLPVDEVCNQADDDCDGQTDEGCLVTWTGVAKDVPLDDLDGWTQCYVGGYDDKVTSFASILAQCDKANLMLACRPANSATLTIAAHAPRSDVTFPTGGKSAKDAVHVANGVGWYHDGSWSWGFAPEGDPVYQDACDNIASSFVPGVDGDKRLCWHTWNDGLDEGWRCGTSEDLFDGTWERLVFHAD